MVFPYVPYGFCSASNITALWMNDVMPALLCYH